MAAAAREYTPRKAWVNPTNGKASRWETVTVIACAGSGRSRGVVARRLTGRVAGIPTKIAWITGPNPGPRPGQRREEGYMALETQMARIGWQNYKPRPAPSSYNCMEDDGILSSERLNRLVHGPGGREFRTEWVIIVGNLAPRTIRVEQFLNTWLAVSST